VDACERQTVFGARLPVDHPQDLPRGGPEDEDALGRKTTGGLAMSQTTTGASWKLSLMPRSAQGNLRA
jgi:hypothetical protein